MGGFVTIPVDSKDVLDQIPVDETVYEFTIEKTRTDFERCQIKVKTTERDFTIDPSSPFFGSAWNALDAMLDTPEGQAFIARLKDAAEEKPVKLSLTREIVAAPLEP